MRNKISEEITEKFDIELNRILSRVFVSEQSEKQNEKKRHAIAVGFSGGLDSSVLLELARIYAQKHGFDLYAFHIHHGLSSNADSWLTHCENFCADKKINFEARRVNVADDGNSLEASARIARYRALDDLCRKKDISVLLTAHHKDDQAETVLLNLLRGSGVAGLAAMDDSGFIPDFAESGRIKAKTDNPVFLARPLLSFTRAELEKAADNRGLKYVEDESNKDTRYVRNALRLEILPKIENYFHAYRLSLTRSAAHMRDAQILLEELAEIDYSDCKCDGGLGAEKLEKLSDARLGNLLRYWLKKEKNLIPSAAWLREVCSQLRNMREDSQVCVSLDDVDVRVYRGTVSVEKSVKNVGVGVNRAVQIFRWNGEKEILFPTRNGKLVFEKSEWGCEFSWLKMQQLFLRDRVGGENLKLAPNRPSRILKDHYRDFGIPAWKRDELPLVFAGENLLFVAGVGMDCRPSWVADGIKLCWKAVL